MLLVRFPSHVFFCHLAIALFLGTCCNGALAERPPWEVGKLSPAWSSVAARRTLHVNHDPAVSDEKNGSALAAAISKLEPGDRLLISAGRYLLDRKFNIEKSGTAADPIWIEGKDRQNLPVITRPDAKQNLINIGERSRVEYVCLRGLELTGGSTLIRFYDCQHVWLDQCHLHHAKAEGITANTRDTSHLFITRNHFHHFTSSNATGEAMYLGANQGKVAMSYSVIALNHVHHCGGKQGDGIEVKQGSHHNWIVRNHVHDTKYPCVLVYGTSGQGINVVEQNTCYRSQDNVMQVQGDAIVRNNLLIDGGAAGFGSTDQQGKTKDLQFIHNTIISKRRGANLTSWHGRQGMVFANNAVYTSAGEAVRFPNGSAGVTATGNVVVGSVAGIVGGFNPGGDLLDFLDVNWDGGRRNAAPSAKSPLIGQATEEYVSRNDITGKARGAASVVGAWDAP